MSDMTLISVIFAMYGSATAVNVEDQITQTITSKPYVCPALM